MTAASVAAAAVGAAAAVAAAAVAVPAADRLCSLESWSEECNSWRSMCSSRKTDSVLRRVLTCSSAFCLKRDKGHVK